MMSDKYVIEKVDSEGSWLVLDSTLKGLECADDSVVCFSEAKAVQICKLLNEREED